MAEIIRRDESVLSDSEKRSLDYTLEKLEAFYPEHKTYAMDALCSQQRENCVKFQKKLGYESIEEFLLAYGFEMIKGPEVYELRKDCGITPGNEPDLIKTRFDNTMKKLNEYYPNHVIERAIQRDHNNLAQTLAGFWQWLGYKDMVEMLDAYGFTYNAKAGRTKSVDPEAIVAELRKRYPEGVAMTVDELRSANPDLKIKSVMNMSKELFGMTFAKYLLEQGILLKIEKAPQKTREEKLEYQRNYAKEKQKEKAAKNLADYEQYYIKSYIGWKMLPPTAELLFQDHDDVKQMQTIKNAVKAAEIDADEYFASIGVVANANTDNELRLRVQQIDFRNIANEINIDIPDDKEEAYTCSKIQIEYIPVIKNLTEKWPSVSATQIAEFLGISASTASKYIGILEAEGLIVKDEDRGVILSTNGDLMFDLIKSRFPEAISDLELETPEEAEPVKKADPIDYEKTLLKGKTFSAAGFSEDEETVIAKSVELNGGIYLYNFSSGLNYLIYNPDCDIEPLKMKKAKLLEKKGEDISFITINEFMNMLSE